MYRPGCRTSRKCFDHTGTARGGGSSLADMDKIGSVLAIGFSPVDPDNVIEHQGPPDAEAPDRSGSYNNNNNIYLVWPRRGLGCTGQRPVGLVAGTCSSRARVVAVCH
jgi:hypothetical protein